MENRKFDPGMEHLSGCGGQGYEGAYEPDSMAAEKTESKAASDRIPSR